MSNDKKETWFDNLDINIIKEEFSKIPEFVCCDDIDHNVISRDTDNEYISRTIPRVGIFIINRTTGHKDNIWFTEYSYVFPTKSNFKTGSYASDDIDSVRGVVFSNSWFNIMRRCNKGRIIQGKTYEEAFKEYHTKEIESEYNKEVQRASLQKVAAEVNRDKKTNFLNAILLGAHNLEHESEM